MTIEEEISIADKAKSGDVDAQLQYGKMLCGLADRVVEGYNGGIEVARYWDLSNDGMRWLAKAAEAGNKEAEELLQRINNHEVHIVTEPEYLYMKAMRYISGDGVKKSLEDASDSLFAAAEIGSKYGKAERIVGIYRELAELCSHIGPRAYMFGEDPVQWIERLARAAEGEKQHMFACVECEGDLSWYPVNDNGYAVGLRWLKEQADAGRREFQWQYGNVLIYASDDLAGIEYLKKSYENGYGNAALSLGDFYSDDAAKAIDWFEKAVKLGSIAAADRLGELLYPSAVRAFAALKENPDAAAEKEIVNHAVSLTKMAAESGYACSQMRFAAMCIDGMVANDNRQECDPETEARSWLVDAERNGSDVASQCIDLILKNGKTTKEAIDICRNSIS